jgi:hypothetical protein
MFNDASCTSDYIASNYTMINERMNGNRMEEVANLLGTLLGYWRRGSEENYENVE